MNFENNFVLKLKMNYLESTEMLYLHPFPSHMSVGLVALKQVMETVYIYIIPVGGGALIQPRLGKLTSRKQDYLLH